MGLFSSETAWIVKSNSEAGDGYSDILIQIPAEKTACIIEVKYADNKNFDAACSKAMKQIEEVNYTAGLQLEGIKTVHLYGIACWSKHCQVAYKKVEL